MIMILWGGNRCVVHVLLLLTAIVPLEVISEVISTAVLLHVWLRTIHVVYPSWQRRGPTVQVERSLDRKEKRLHQPQANKPVSPPCESIEIPRYATKTETKRNTISACKSTNDGARVPRPGLVGGWCSFNHGGSCMSMPWRGRG